jgi:uncharacterized protein YecE (DUF72 family)
MPSREYLTHYATQCRTVEVDSTFYGTRSASTVMAWNEKTPDDFIFSVKVPQVITHEKVLVDCQPEFDEFIDRMKLLGEKLGPLVFQFPHFDQFQFKSASEFLPRLRSFLQKLRDIPLKFVIEIRNKSWLDARFADVLREYGVALALTDTSFLLRPWEMKEKFDLVTADFVYVRWLGNRKEIEKQTMTWDKTIVDRSADLKSWVELFRQFMRRDLKVTAYANNHYAGNGPGDGEAVRMFGRVVSEWAEEEGGGSHPFNAVGEIGPQMIRAAVCSTGHSQTQHTDEVLLVPHLRLEYAPKPTFNWSISYTSPQFDS